MAADKNLRAIGRAGLGTAFGARLHEPQQVRLPGNERR
jgi:hypothetical protein